MGRGHSPLNTLVVSKNSGLPSDGADFFIRRFLRKRANARLSDKDRPVLVDQVLQQVWHYPHAKWDRVAKALDAEILEPRHKIVSDEEPIELPTVPQHRKPESSEHKALKAWVCANPSFFRALRRFQAGRSGQVIPSGDRLDGLFANERMQLAVEVKASHASDAELSRGVFQCIKYRAVLRAAQLAQGDIPNAQGVLVTTRTPDRTTKRLCRRLQVQCLLPGPSIE